MSVNSLRSLCSWQLHKLGYYSQWFFFFFFTLGIFMFIGIIFTIVGKLRNWF